MGGMGGSRHLLITALSEPTLVFVFAAYALTTGESTIDGIVAEAPDLLRAPFLGLSVLAFILVALAENDRYPTDNPETSLELTMVREAMLSHYSGAYLSMLEYAAMVKYAVFVLLIGNLVLPGYLLGQGSGPAFVCFVGVAMLFKVTIASLAIALLEMTIAKMRLSRMQEYFLGAFFLSLAGFVLVLVSARL